MSDEPNFSNPQDPFAPQPQNFQTSEPIPDPFSSVPISTSSYRDANPRGMESTSEPAQQPAPAQVSDTTSDPFKDLPGTTPSAFNVDPGKIDLPGMPPEHLPTATSNQKKKPWIIIAVVAVLFLCCCCLLAVIGILAASPEIQDKLNLSDSLLPTLLLFA